MQKAITFIEASNMHQHYSVLSNNSSLGSNEEAIAARGRGLTLNVFQSKVVRM